ncbi:MAG TPA: twin-arginine translocase subunit TatC [Candidatus Eremiobacteraeota bacterium]|nr:twin-arginine translocase subunit TatC [Candidatus Eremiobacteraeota bacterium]
MEEKMTVIEHLEELRWRIIISLLSVLFCSTGGYFVAKSIMNILAVPLGDNKLVFLTPSEGFVTHIQISLVCGIVMASPLVLYQIWAFIRPALTVVERKYAFIFIPLIVFLFGAGVTMATFIILPVGVRFLITFSTMDLQPMLSVSNYFSFALSVIICTGLVFELPLLALLLGKIGIINFRMLCKVRRYAFLIAFVIAAVITPSVDMFTQILVAVPIILLYEGSIILLKIFKL